MPRRRQVTAADLWEKYQELQALYAAAPKEVQEAHTRRLRETPGTLAYNLDQQRLENWLLYRDADLARFAANGLKDRKDVGTIIRQCRMEQEGLTDRQIADQLDDTIGNVRKRRQRYGKPRPQSPPPPRRG